MTRPVKPRSEVHQALSEEKRPISLQQLFDNVDILLDMLNTSGGYASYELIRAPKLLELINPAEVFGRRLSKTSPWEYVDSNPYR